LNLALRYYSQIKVLNETDSGDGLRRFDLRLLDWGIDLIVSPLDALNLAILGGTVASIGTATYLVGAGYHVRSPLPEVPCWEQLSCLSW
jgi:hypothetical protein